MTHSRFPPRWLALALALMLAACTASPTATPTAAGVAPTLTPPPPTRTATATHTPTPVPTDTPAPTITPTPYPPERLAFIENDGLVLINSDGTGYERLEFLDGYFMHNTEGGVFPVATYLESSFNGRYLAFDGEKDEARGIFIADLVEQKVLGPISDGIGNVGISWSPNQAKFVFVQDVEIADSRGNKSWKRNLAIYDVETGQATRLTENDSFDLYPSWSPDGQWIAFVRVFVEFPCLTVNSPGCYNSLSLIRPDGSDLRSLTNDIACTYAIPHWDPAWSPDSQWLSILSLASESTLVHIETGEIRPLGFYFLERPEWTPDGRLFFTSGQEGNGELYTLTPGDAEATNLTHTPGAEAGFPAWSRSGRFVAFYYYEQEKSALCVMQADGSNRTCFENQDDGSITWLPTQYP